MRVIAVPVLDDNYAYLLCDDEGGASAAVDPAQPQKVLEAAKAHSAPPITTILTTHHHWDHADGNEEMVQLLGGSVTVVGGDDRIPALNKKVADGDVVMVGNIAVNVLFTPCHTTGHVLYYVAEGGGAAPALFSGDTLFVGGCGRFFEGTAEQMHAALNGKVAALPDPTRLFCGHEYTSANLAFALLLEPANPPLLAKAEWAKRQREEGQPTIPSTLGEEKAYNPFMRVHVPAVKRAVGLPEAAPPHEVMAAVRAAKNRGRL
eukprot:TRINITY_DN2209_c0_g1_i1.p2 TRINITY_DN2209_c0_g1~~TRINITY_DN2209_c0_g1_i1.p2  ORF type:complete len:297 (-),score=114.17 TRINITY_DN2209_c0_g1_i1:234-1019(-)